MEKRRGEDERSRRSRVKKEREEEGTNKQEALLELKIFPPPLLKVRYLALPV